MTYSIDLSMPHAGEYRSFFLWPMFSFQVYPGNVLNTYHWRAHDVGHCTLSLIRAGGLKSEHSILKLQQWMREGIDD